MKVITNRHGNTSSGYYRFVIVILASVVSVGIYLNSIKQPPKTGSAAFYAPGVEVVVKVSGEVKHPGIYVVPANSMANSVIKMADAGGAEINNANLGCYNDQLKNGSEIRVSVIGDNTINVSCVMMSVKEMVALQIPLDINNMGLADLVLVPGIEPGLADNIFAYRQSVGGSMGVKDLTNVSGIGKSKYLHIRKYFNMP